MLQGLSPEKVPWVELEVQSKTDLIWTHSYTFPVAVFFEELPGSGQGCMVSKARVLPSGSSRKWKTSR